MEKLEPERLGVEESNRRHPSDMENLQRERARLEDAKRRLVKSLKMSEEAKKALERKNQDLLILLAQGLDKKEGDMSASTMTASCSSTCSVPPSPGHSLAKSAVKCGQQLGISSRPGASAASLKGDPHLKRKASLRKVRQKNPDVESHPLVTSAPLPQQGGVESGMSDFFDSVEAAGKHCESPEAAELDIISCKPFCDEHALRSPSLDHELDSNFCKDCGGGVKDDASSPVKRPATSSPFSDFRSWSVPAHDSCISADVYCGREGAGSMSDRQPLQGEIQPSGVIVSRRESSRSTSPRHTERPVASEDAARQVMHLEGLWQQSVSSIDQECSNSLSKKEDRSQYDAENHSCQCTPQQTRSRQKARHAISSINSGPTSGNATAPSAGSSRASSCQRRPVNSRRNSPTAKCVNSPANSRPPSRRASPKTRQSKNSRTVVTKASFDRNVVETPPLPSARYTNSLASHQALVRMECMQRNFDQAVVDQWQKLHALWPAVQIEGSCSLGDETESVDDSSAPSTPVSATLLSVAQNRCLFRSESECQEVCNMADAKDRCEIDKPGDGMDETPTSAGDESSSGSTSTTQPQVPPCFWCPSTMTRYTLPSLPSCGLPLSQSARLQGKPLFVEQDTSVNTASSVTGGQKTLQRVPQTERRSGQAECRLSAAQFEELVAVIRGRSSSAAPQLKFPAGQPTPTLAFTPAPAPAPAQAPAPASSSSSAAAPGVGCVGITSCAEKLPQACSTPHASLNKAALGPLCSPWKTNPNADDHGTAESKRENATSCIVLEVPMEARSRPLVRSPCAQSRVVPSPSPVPVSVRVPSREPRTLILTPQALHGSIVSIQSSSEPASSASNVARFATDSVAMCSSRGSSVCSRAWPRVNPPKSEAVLMRHMQSQPLFQTHPNSRVVVKSSAGMGSTPFEPPCTPLPGFGVDWNHQITSGVTYVR